jgi:hypothetical protein
MELEKYLLPYFMNMDAYQDGSYFDLAIKSMLNFCSDDELKAWTSIFFKASAEHALSYTYNEKDRYRDRSKYLACIIKLVRHPRLFASWVQSKSIMGDLERLYFAHLVSKSDALMLYTSMYYPDTSFVESAKAGFYKLMAAACQKCAQTQDLLLALTQTIFGKSGTAADRGSEVLHRQLLRRFIDHLIKKNRSYVQDIVRSKLN